MAEGETKAGKRRRNTAALLFAWMKKELEGGNKWWGTNRAQRDSLQKSQWCLPP